MHPTRISAAFKLNRLGGRVMRGVRWLLSDALLYHNLRRKP
jgi:hypothetical protein